ncbi:DMT family transporter [Verminephrobacter aporrectodeae]|uniref:EamA family transporter n=1 Tax=Verminephrobacter aporrectodeae subsp. tuberculatae TaxID=1110392 RepID=A0ABT3KYI6_9BURK|nr:EamA family transporter [Verminephrobacter aporrectodeae]MCW5256246.1 EamA family transporter [Verminephrobacter aporrectodeae subsp. tuberculatae]MCW5323394.1 EamA family transporter [Verminephrobacter aporrectodeae subsp. tuberculatae]MCW8175105.1 EamA family transporter [Verminephrobacter aporrectodeae subsp. tuberculatae]MCW8198005.1 EamA family transporter [Verminephrobacter aporrectodeae subsp. tuberculatae]MCW8202481.1 EamA family transporter [Verminephrobacter aporrectodeae subsp. t
MARAKENPVWAQAALVLAVFFWASSFVAMKHAVGHMDPGLIVLIRMIIASSCFLLIYRLWRGMAYTRGDWKYFLIMSVCDPGLYFFLESQALKYTSASAAGTINSLQPPLLALSAWVFLRERPSLVTFIGAAISIVGAVLLTAASPSIESSPNPWLGNTLEFGAMASSTIYIVVLKKLSDRYSPLFLTALQAFGGALLFAPLLWTADIPATVPTSAWIAIFYLATFVTFGGYFLYNWGVAKSTAMIASAYLNLIPVFSVGLAFVFLDERLTIFQICMVLVIIMGVFVSQSAQFRRPAALHQ